MEDVYQQHQAEKSGGNVIQWKEHYLYLAFGTFIQINVTKVHYNHVDTYTKLQESCENINFVLATIRDKGIFKIIFFYGGSALMSTGKWAGMRHWCFYFGSCFFYFLDNQQASSSAAFFKLQTYFRNCKQNCCISVLYNKYVKKKKRYIKGVEEETQLYRERYRSMLLFWNPSPHGRPCRLMESEPD